MVEEFNVEALQFNFERKHVLVFYGFLYAVSSRTVIQKKS